MELRGEWRHQAIKRTDGSTRYSTYVVCDHVQFLESKKSQWQSQSSPQQEAGFQTQSTTFDSPFSQPGTNPFVPNSVPSTYTPGQSQASSMINIDDDDLPF